MRDPLATETERREYVCIGDGPCFKYVLSCFEMPPEVRISDRLGGEGEDYCEKDENERQSVRLLRIYRSSS